MKPALKLPLLLAALASAGALLSGCMNRIDATQTSIGPPDDFGRAVREDLAAQIADPDPAWKNTPQPASSGERAALAQKAYGTDNVKTPQGLNTLTAATPAGGGGGGGGGGGSP